MRKKHKNHLKNKHWKKNEMLPVIKKEANKNSDILGGDLCNTWPIQD